MKYFRTLAAAVSVSVCTPAIASAQPKDQGQEAKGPEAQRGNPAKAPAEVSNPWANSKKAVKEDPEAAQQRREGLRDKLRERTGPRDQRREQYSARFQAKLKQLRESREQRRSAHRERLKAKWGDFAERAAVRAEFKTHAWRMARLRRMQLLAEELKKPALLERTKQLMAQETARHAKRLDQLKAAGGKAGPTKNQQPETPKTDLPPAPAAEPSSTTPGKE